MLILNLIFCGGGLAKPGIDSLRQLILKNSGDPTKLSVLYSDLSREYLRSGNDSSLQAAMTGLNLAEKANSLDGILHNCVSIGLYYLSSDSLNLARKYFLRALKISGKDSDPVLKMKTLNGLGYISDLQSDYAGALNYYMQGKELAEETGNIIWRADFLNNIAAFYNSAGVYEKSIRLFIEASNIYREKNDSVYYANSLVNIGRAYLGLKKYDSSLAYYRLAIPIQQRLKNYYGLANLYLGLSAIDFELSRFQESLANVNTGMKMIDSLDKTFHGSTAYMRANTEEQMGEIFQKIKNYSEAESHYRNAIKYSKQGSFLLYETNALGGLSEIMEITGRIDSALFYSKLHHRFADSLWLLSNKQKIVLTELEFSFKNQQEKQRIETEKGEAISARNKMIFILSISLVFGISLLLLLLYLLQRNKTRHTNLQKINLELENVSLEKDVDLKNKELVLQSMNLAERKEVMTEMSNKLQVIIQTSTEENISPLRTLLHDFNSKSSERFWDEFNAHFRDVHPQFYTSLTKDHPGLTPTEIKLCAFIRLNLTTKEIEQLTRKSENTIKIARHRLRHKLGLGRADNLTGYLNKY